MVRCEHPGCDYEFDDTPSPRPADIIGQWYRRMFPNGTAHKVVAASYSGINTIATTKCGQKFYVHVDGFLKRKPKKARCTRCSRG